MRTQEGGLLTRLVLAGALVLGAPALTYAQLVDVEGRYWSVDLDASAKVKNHSVPGTDIDLKNVLGLEHDGAPDLRLSVATGLAGRIRATYTHFDFDKDTTLGATVQFAGSTFTASTRVESELELHYGRLGWIWQPIAIPGILQLGPVFELKGFVGDMSLRTLGITTPVRESQTFALALPTAGLALDVTPLRMLHLFAEASGLPAGDLGHFVDAEAGLKFVPIRWVALTASYRVVDMRAAHHSDFIQARLSGPAFGLSIRFP